jgi:hypothetical protein
MADVEAKGGDCPAPWTGQAEASPIGDTGDHDMPFVIRDGMGDVVLTIWEQYRGSSPMHEIIGQRIVEAVNAVDVAKPGAGPA